MSPAPEGNDNATGRTPAKDGNDNAVGNDGGAPAAGNQNAARHGLHSDPANVLADLRERDPESYAWIESKMQDYLEQTPYTDGSPEADQLRQIAVREHSIWRATGLQLEEGIVKQTRERTPEGDLVEVESENPVNLPLDRMERTVMRRLKELGVLGDEGGQMSQASMESEAYVVVSDSDSDSDESDDVDANSE
jgi:hypothetical protein